MILDSTFLIDLLEGVPEAKDKAVELDESSVSVLTTSVSVFEVWQGIEPIKSVERAEELLDSLGLLNFGVDDAKRAGQIMRELRNKGQEIDGEDCMIAGIALEHHHPLLTRNVKHFSRIQGLRVETY